jgi:hypothetical protein
MMCSQYDTNGIGMYIPVCCVVVFTYDDDDKRKIMSMMCSLFASFLETVSDRWESRESYH